MYDMPQQYFTQENFQRLIEALAFYGDPDTYTATKFFCDPPCGPIAKDIGIVTEVDYNNTVLGEIRVPGQLARDTLQAILYPDQQEDDK